tara:strand:+ start:29229 stop:29441 length:213 start_codon:yes stop_codon:yes gene_type:complete
MGNETLANYYKTNFALIHHHKYSLSEIEDMMPFERDIYVLLLTQHLEKENERIRTQEAQAKQKRKNLPRI